MPRALLLTLLAFLCGGCSVPYLVRQAAGQAELLAAARPVTEHVARGGLAPRQLEALDECAAVLDFARAHEFNVGSAYTNYVDLGRHPRVIMLLAAYPDQLRAYTWWFPVVGRVSYKGFFDLDAALRQRSLLESRGYETWSGYAAAYSSLGWFPDPIFSNMLDETSGRRAEVLLHELTHRTLFFGSDLRFNENLASFVGEYGAEKFLQEQNGADTRKIDEYRAQRADAETLRRNVKQTVAELTVAFAAPDRAERLAGRERVFAALRTRLEGETWHLPRERQGWRAARWSVPLILAQQLYAGDQSLFSRAFDRAGGTIPRFFDTLKGIDPGPDAVAALEAWLETPETP